MSVPNRPRDRPLVVDGVARNLLSRPSYSGTFDLLESSYDNAGNAIHAEAPFSFWDDGSGVVIDARELRRHRRSTLRDSIDFANRKKATYVLSAANFIQFDGMSNGRLAAYTRLQKELERLEGPLVVLGLGVQAPRGWDARDHALPQEALDLMRFFGQKCKTISVRGDFTASILRDYADVKNTWVTGCPSFYQRAEAFEQLRAQLCSSDVGITTISVTNLKKPAEAKLLSQAMRHGHEWLDVRCPRSEELDAILTYDFSRPTSSEERAWISTFDHPKSSDVALRSQGRLQRRHFHDYRSWIDFVQRNVRVSYGTRLHASMASLIGGKPAVWIAHDTRTIEATNHFRLPALPLSDAADIGVAGLHEFMDYEPLFSSVNSLFKDFNEFLDAVDLPSITEASL